MIETSLNPGCSLQGAQGSYAVEQKLQNVSKFPLLADEEIQFASGWIQGDKQSN